MHVITRKRLIELAGLSAIAYLNSDEFLVLTGQAQYQKQVKEVQ